MLFCSHLANGDKHEFGVHHKTNQGRGRKAESGSAIARRHRSKTNEDEGNEAHHVGSGSSENQPGAEKALAKTKGQAPKPKRAISAAGRKRIAAAQRARWAKIRAAKKAG